MRKGYIYHLHNRYFDLSIWVYGYIERSYNGYSMKDAIKDYRNRYGLVGKKIRFVEVEK